MGRLFISSVAVRGALQNHEYCERARKINIDRLRLVITTSTSSLIPRKHSHKLEHVQGLGTLRKLRGVGRVEVAPGNIDEILNSLVIV